MERLLVLLLLAGCTSTGYASLDSATLDPQDPRRITVQGIHGTCDELQEVEVDEDDEQVTVAVRVRTPRRDCNDAGVVFERSVQLADELGARRLQEDGRVLPVVGRDRCRPSPDSDPTLLGLTVDQARARHGARPFRIACVDGRELVRTADRRPDRLDVSVDDGVVSATSLG